MDNSTRPETESSSQSETLGRFSYFPDYDEEIANLNKEIDELKSRIAQLEERQKGLPWWKRIRKASE